MSNLNLKLSIGLFFCIILSAFAFTSFESNSSPSLLDAERQSLNPNYPAIEAAVNTGALDLNANELAVLRNATTHISLSGVLALKTSDDDRCCCTIGGNDNCLPNVLVSTCQASGFVCRGSR